MWPIGSPKRPRSGWLPSKFCVSWPTRFTCLPLMKANQLNPDFKEFIELLNVHAVEQCLWMPQVG